MVWISVHNNSEFLGKCYCVDLISGMLFITTTRYFIVLLLFPTLIWFLTDFQLFKCRKWTFCRCALPNHYFSFNGIEFEYQKNTRNMLLTFCIYLKEMLQQCSLNLNDMLTNRDTPIYIHPENIWSSQLALATIRVFFDSQMSEWISL